MGRCLLEVGLYRRVVGGEVFVKGRFIQASGRWGGVC